MLLKLEGFHYDTSLDLNMGLLILLQIFKEQFDVKLVAWKTNTVDLELKED